MIRDVIWDVDGTLFDTYPAIARAFSLALQEHGAEVALERIVDLARQSLGHCANTLAGQFGLDASELTREFQGHYARMPDTEQPPFHGVAHVCDYVVATGGRNYIVTHRGRASLQRLLVAHQMTGYFTDCLSADDGFPKKPDPAAFEELMRRHGLEREAVLAVGDREIDVLAGQAAGVQTCLFGQVAPGVEPDYAINDFAELYCLLVSEHGEESHLGT